MWRGRQNRVCWRIQHPEFRDPMKGPIGQLNDLLNREQSQAMQIRADARAEYRRHIGVAQGMSV
jgi:hypothetical protein